MKIIHRLLHLQILQMKAKTEMRDEHSTNGIKNVNVGRSTALPDDQSEKLYDICS